MRAIALQTATKLVGTRANYPGGTIVQYQLKTEGGKREEGEQSRAPEVSGTVDPLSAVWPCHLATSNRPLEGSADGASRQTPPSTEEQSCGYG